MSAPPGGTGQALNAAVKVTRTPLAERRAAAVGKAYPATVTTSATTAEPDS